MNDSFHSTAAISLERTSATASDGRRTFESSRATSTSTGSCDIGGPCCGGGACRFGRSAAAAGAGAASSSAIAGAAPGAGVPAASAIAFIHRRADASPSAASRNVRGVPSADTPEELFRTRLPRRGVLTAAPAVATVNANSTRPSWRDILWTRAPVTSITPFGSLESGFCGCVSVDPLSLNHRFCIAVLNCPAFIR